MGTKIAIIEERAEENGRVTEFDKCSNPTLVICNCGSNGIRGKKGQRVGVTSGRIGRIRESVLPRLEISEILERDFTEKVFSGTWNP